MATTTELKAQAYDIFLQVSFLNNKLQQLQQEIQAAGEQEESKKPEV